MKYMGSKNRIAKQILPIILKDRKEGQWYVEPFCGGCNTLDKVTGNRIGNDKNRYLIAMWKGLLDGRPRPHDITKDIYAKARDEFYGRADVGADDFLIGWVGFMGSFNGRFFDGGYSGKTETRDYVKEQIKNTENQIGLLKDVIFYSGDYDELPYPAASIIYCDIPYNGTKSYSASKEFDHEKFFEWCRKMSRAGHSVFVSEYSAPRDFSCVWQGALTNSLHPKLTKATTEKLFTFLPTYPELD